MNYGQIVREDSFEVGKEDLVDLQLENSDQENTRNAESELGVTVVTSTI